MAERCDGMLQFENERMGNYQIIPLSNYPINYLVAQK